MKLKWIGVDCGSADHPFNTKIRDWMPHLAVECDEYLRRKYGKSMAEMFPNPDYQLMHTALFPHGLIHAENLGGEMTKLLNRRTTVGCFPWKFVDGESAFCRIVAFEEE